MPASTPQRFEYKAVQVRFQPIGGRVDAVEVERVLNEHAAIGWQLVSVTETQIESRIGPRGVTGLLVVFERPATGMT